MIHPTGFFRPDQYIKPTSAKEAVELLSRHGDSAWPVAGGTDLVVEKNPGVNTAKAINAAKPSHLTR